MNKLFIIFILKHIVHISGHPSSQCTHLNCSSLPPQPPYLVECHIPHILYVCTPLAKTYQFSPLIFEQIRILHTQYTENFSIPKVPLPTGTVTHTHITYICDRLCTLQYSCSSLNLTARISSHYVHHYLLDQRQFKREYMREFFRKFRVVSACFGLLRNRSVCFGCFDIGSKHRNKPKFFLFGFTKQTEKNVKQILFQFVSVRTENYFCLFRGHPSLLISPRTVAKFALAVRAA